MMIKVKVMKIPRRMMTKKPTEDKDEKEENQAQRDVKEKENYKSIL